MVGAAAYMVKVRLKLTQLPTKLKLKLKLSLAITSTFQDKLSQQYKDLITDFTMQGALQPLIMSETALKIRMKRLETIKAKLEDI